MAWSNFTWIAASAVASAAFGCGSDPEPPRGPAGALIEPNPGDAHQYGSGSGALGNDHGVNVNASSGGGGVGGRGSGGVPNLGGSSSTGRCTGSATPCSLLGPGECSLALGCSPAGECSGFVGSCYSQVSSYSCSSLSGCYWSYSSSSCSGVPFSCSTFYGDLSCVGQSGCYWSDACTGGPTPCSLLATSECSLQPGCVVTP